MRFTYEPLDKYEESALRFCAAESLALGDFISLEMLTDLYTLLKVPQKIAPPSRLYQEASAEGLDEWEYSLNVLQRFVSTALYRERVGNGKPLDALKEVLAAGRVLSPKTGKKQVLESALIMLEVLTHPLFGELVQGAGKAKPLKKAAGGSTGAQINLTRLDTPFLTKKATRSFLSIVFAAHEVLQTASRLRREQTQARGTLQPKQLVRPMQTITEVVRATPQFFLSDPVVQEARLLAKDVIVRSTDLVDPKQTTLAILLDVSGSMTETVGRGLTKAAAAVILCLGALDVCRMRGDTALLSTFAGKVIETYTCKKEEDFIVVAQKLARVYFGSPDTAIMAAIRHAVARLKELPIKNGKGSKDVLLITDGESPLCHSELRGFVAEGFNFKTVLLSAKRQGFAHPGMFSPFSTVLTTDYATFDIKEVYAFIRN